MTPEQLAEIKARAEKASPGPWEKYKLSREVEGPRMTIYDEGGHSHEDAEFIAHARQDIPALLAYVEELEKELHHYHQEVGWSEADCQSGKCRQTPPMK